MRKTIIVDNKKLHLEIGYIIDTWDRIYGDKSDLWSFPIEELIDGTIEINEDIWYWLIKGRCYETDEEVTD